MNGDLSAVNAAGPRPVPIAEPGGSPTVGPLPPPLRGRCVSLAERILPPLGLALRLVRLALPPRYRGEKTTPASPWTLLQAGIVLAGIGALVYRRFEVTVVARGLEAATGACQRWAASADAQAHAATVTHWLAIMWSIAGKAMLYLAMALHWLAAHAGPVMPVFGAYLFFLGLSLAAHGLDRHRARHQWLMCRDLLHRVRHGQSWLDRSHYHRHLAAHAALLLGALLAVAWAWWPFSWAYSALFRQSLVAAFVPYPLVQRVVTLGLLVGVLLLVGWSLVRRLAGRLPFAAWPAPAGKSLDQSNPVPTALPVLTVDGRVAIPQMRPTSPLVVRARDLDTMGPHGSASRRFATLFAMGLATDCSYEPGGNLAGSSTWGASVFGAVNPGALGDATVVRGNFKQATPAELVTQLCRLMYLAAGVDGRIDRLANAVARDFCLSHSLPRLVPEDELATLLKAVAAEDWPRRTPTEAAAIARQAIDALDALPPVQQYISEWFEHSSGLGVRHGSGTFDPMHNGRFQDAGLSFSEMARLLVQAVVYADRRIDDSESTFIGLLHLQGDFDSGASVAMTNSAPTDGTVGP